MAEPSVRASKEKLETFVASKKQIAKGTEETLEVLHQARLPPRLATREDHRRPQPRAEVILILLFEAVREVIFNIVKHSGENEAAVALDRDEEGRTRLTIADRNRFVEHWRLHLGEGRVHEAGMH